MKLRDLSDKPRDWNDDYERQYLSILPALQEMGRNPSREEWLASRLDRSKKEKARIASAKYRSPYRKNSAVPRGNRG